ncbi:hypothetical protein [Pararhizobium haloflavum]|uniref:hypothetical protein n=1 Tax=Pararhizobium haloflavum TaxID=2037914 RepID=UPI0012FFD909|nr:hypothetical protein [Pararhizobium haloflavum]
MSDSTTLVIGTPEAFIELRDTANLGQVESLHIGARFYQSMQRDQLFAWIGRLPALRLIHMADDWIADDQMAAVAAAFAASFPSVDFAWSHDCLAGGKHGR